MGFGISLFGYAFLLMNELGGAVLAAPILAYGFFLASRLDRGFLYAAVSAMFMLPRGIVNLLNVIGVIDLPRFAALNLTTFILYLASWAAISFFFCTAVMRIAAECNAEKLRKKASNRLYFTLLFIFFSLVLAVLNTAGITSGADAQVMAVQYILQYTVIIVNILFLHTCFIMITSEKQYEEDKHSIAEERAKALEKQHNEQKRG